jgi:hypothetical protein
MVAETSATAPCFDGIATPCVRLWMFPCAVYLCVLYLRRVLVFKHAFRAPVKSSLTLFRNCNHSLLSVDRLSPATSVRSPPLTRVSSYTSSSLPGLSCYHQHRQTDWY